MTSSRIDQLLTEIYDRGLVAGEPAPSVFQPGSNLSQGHVELLVELAQAIRDLDERVKELER